MLPLTWLVIMWILKTSFGKAILAWLPTLAAPLLAFLLLLAVIPSFADAGHERARRAGCRMNLETISKALAIYHKGHQDTYPLDLQQLIDEGQDPKYFRCPAADGDRSYFYLAPAGKSSWDPTETPEMDPRTIIACDLAGNHKNYRNFLRADFSVSHAREAQFQELLKEPCNAEFAAALRQAEASSALTP